MDTRSERARAVLVGAAYGDALAMPTCGMTPEQITSIYGDFKELIDADASHTTMPGAPAGTVTEVTREILAEASALLGGSFSFPVTADDAHSPTDHTHARRCVLHAIPVGIATSTQDPEAFADAVWGACAEGPTTRQEFQAAALIATFISIGLDWPHSRPMDITGVLWETVNYVASMEQRGSWSAEPDERCVVPAIHVFLRVHQGVRAPLDPHTDRSFRARLYSSCPIRFFTLRRSSGRRHHLVQCTCCCPDGIRPRGLCVSR